MMNILVVYDSTYGNTQQIAKAIGAAITGEVKVLRANEVNIAELNSFDLLVVGSPTQGARPMPSVVEFIGKIPESALKGKNFAAFDTRIAMAKLFGVAAVRIAKILKEKGAIAVVPPEGFNVTAEKAPKLKEGELERAGNWAKILIK
jgi:flavodoxin